MLVERLAQKFRKVRSVNETSATFRSIVPTATEPQGDAATATGASIQEAGPTEGVLSHRGILLVPFGTGNAGTYFHMRVIGWRPANTDNDKPESRLWMPLILAEFQCILGTIVGVAGRLVVATERFCDSKTYTTGVIAYVAVGLGVVSKAEVAFSTESSATDCNALYCFL